MIKLIGYILIITIVILSIFGFLILIEYLKYLKRLLVLFLRSKLSAVRHDPGEVQQND